MSQRAATYLRVSTGEQTTDNQRRDLEAVARARGWAVVAVYDVERQPPCPVPTTSLAGVLAAAAEVSSVQSAPS